MSHNAIVYYLDMEDSSDDSQPLSGRLSDALEKYQIDSEIQDLSLVYSKYLAHEKKLERGELGINGVLKSLGTFNLVPSASYENYLSVLDSKSDLEAIRSDWEMVGEDLSLALIKYTIEGI